MARSNGVDIDHESEHNNGITMDVWKIWVSKENGHGQWITIMLQGDEIIVRWKEGGIGNGGIICTEQKWISRTI